MTRAVTWQQLALINLFGGFTFGIAVNMIVILTGLLAAETKRGQSFGLLTFMVGLALVVSGLVFGPVVDRFGFPVLFVINAGLCLACLLPGLFFTEPVAPPRKLQPVEVASQGLAGRTTLGRSFYLLTVAAFVVALANFGSGLGRSIAMSELHFSATAISITTAIGGAVSLPAPLVIGWLSDRIGRRRLLLLCLAAGFASLLILAFAGSAWSFWSASVLLALMGSAQPLMQALAADLLPPASVGVGLSLLSSSTAAGLFVSSLGIAVAIQQMGQRPSFLILAATPLLATLLLLPRRERGRVDRVFVK